MKLPAPPAQPRTVRPGSALGVAAIVTALLGLLLLPILFEPVALILGASAVYQGYTPAWWAVGIGGVGTVYAVYRLAELSNALSNLG